MKPMTILPFTVRGKTWVMRVAALLVVCGACVGEEKAEHLRPSPWVTPASKEPTEFSWQPLDVFFGVLFPSIELARTASMNPGRTAKDTGPNALGAFPNSPYSVEINSPPGVRVKVEVSCEEFMEPSSVEVQVEKGGQYAVVPLVKWKEEALRACRDRREAKVTWKVWMNGRELPGQTRTVTAQPVSILPITYTRPNKSVLPLFHFVAAYANENHPALDQIVKEARETLVVDKFTGLADNDPQKVKDQVMAIWWALQKRGIVYSDISANVKLPEDSVFFGQRVRFFEDVINAQAANCIDGTLVFASLLRHIGLEPVICLIQGHAFLGYYLDKEKKTIAYLETTGLNNRELYVLAKKKAESMPGHLPKGIFPETEGQTCPGTIDVARAMFDIATDTAAEEAKKAQAADAAGTGFFFPVDLAKQRASILPIPSPKGK